MNYHSTLHIGEREISLGAPAYFIADIASNHDGDLARAQDLIHLAREAGADAVKFQHFLAKDIVSDHGFRNLGGQMSHQEKWDKPVYQIYEQYEFNRSWNEALAETARGADVEFMTTPYDLAAVEEVDALVRAYKIGSGDITWPDFIQQVSQRGKPLFLATGAATLADVERAVAAVLKVNPQLGLMQCNTNYTGSLDNFRSVNLRVLESFRIHYPGMVLGLSDHTPGHSAVLGAIALGARVIEKHFTDDNHRNGPDHGFSMNPQTWREMVDRSRELEMALGDGIKRIEANETDTVIVQRRCLRLCRNLPAGTLLDATHLESLRPAPADSLPPYRLAEVLGRRLRVDKVAGETLWISDLAGKE
ncbi:MAG: N-acetylneuraminate synthase family protein [Magnetococcales bacterium]|nr:N-acetylneuraminate synthase family protein [Magnetococcales bacterium]